MGKLSAYQNSMLRAEEHTARLKKLRSNGRALDFENGSMECAMKEKISCIRHVKKTNKQIEHRAESLLNRHVHFHGRASRFEFESHDGTLFVRGSVPSFYLRESLQNALKDVEGVRFLENLGLSGTNPLTAPGPTVEKSTANRRRQASTITNCASGACAPYRTFAC
jgi:hypothetical protein